MYKNHSVVDCFYFAVWRPRDNDEDDVYPKSHRAKINDILIFKTDNTYQSEELEF